MNFLVLAVASHATNGLDLCRSVELLGRREQGRQKDDVVSTSEITVNGDKNS